MSFNLTVTKQKLTRQLNALEMLIKDAEQYSPTWQFPIGLSDLKVFLSTNEMKVKKLKQQIEEQTDKIWTLYEASIQSIANSPDHELLEDTFTTYWEERRADKMLSLAVSISQQLDKRLLELECQNIALKITQNNSTSQSITTVPDQPATHESIIQPLNTLTLEQRLLNSELKVPEFNGNPAEFGPFWELFEELVHKQPYSNIGKLSILLSCCKGDAARSLRMIPRTGDSYEKAIQQLKSQYEDPKRITIQMIRQLKSMKPCHDDPRTLRNNLSDVQAIIATIQKQGEVVDSTYMITVVTETFPKIIQEEIARKEFDNGKQWTMEELISNLTTIIKRREHIESRNDNLREQHSVFHTRTHQPILTQCIGCGRFHKLQFCTKYPTTQAKIERLRNLNACWKCFNTQHKTISCDKPDCTVCGGHHNPIICSRQSNTRRYSRSLQRLRNTFSTNVRNQLPTTYARQQQYRRPTFSPSSTHRKRSTERNRFGNNSTPQVSYRSYQRTTHSPRQRQQRDTEYRRDTSPLQQSRQFHQNKVRFAPMSHASNPVNVNFQSNSSVHPQQHTKFYDRTTSDTNVRLMVVPVTVRNEHDSNEELVYALLDSASDQSFITSSLAERLQLKPRAEADVIVNTFGGRSTTQRVKHVEALLINQKVQSLKVKLLTNDTITNALTLVELQSQDKTFLQEKFPELLQPWLYDSTREITPDILLGMDYFNSVLLLNEPVVQLPSGLLMTPTFFGPVISGALNNNATSHMSYLLNTHTSQWFQDRPNMDYSDLWKLPGVGTEELSTDEEVNKQIISSFYSTVKINDGKIYVQFPWKSNKHCLADNYTLALSRLHQLYNMRTRNPQCWRDYCKIISEQLDKGFVEEAPLAQDCTGPVYYIPHQAVIKASSETTKTRIVLDASSKMKGQLSLNDVIHQGPLILPSLCGILLRARFGPKIMIADVEKAFHMIYLQESQRDSVRFLWLKDTDKPPIPGNVHILRFCRLPFGINASPFLLGISIQYEIEQQKHQDNTITQQLIDNLYVDNVLMLDTTTQSLLHTYHTCKRIFENMSMNLRQFLTNDELCNNSIATKDKSTASVTKILGILWQHTTDTFSISCKLTHSPHPTKRKILQATHSTFDPLGLLIPLLLPAKILLQDLWKHKHKWDELLPDNYNNTWKAICEQTDGFSINFPRMIAPKYDTDQYELHSFVDASIHAHAAVVYLRSINDRSEITSSILMARQRLTPLNAKTLTIPRLELLALLIGVRLTGFVLKEIKLNLSGVNIYSDSQVALHWVQYNTKNGTFVDNRCTEIRDKIQSWTQEGILPHLYYIPSEINPADLATKGLTKDKMKQQLWWSGPAFLQHRNTEWPELNEFSWLTKTEQHYPHDDKNSTPLTTLSLVSKRPCQLQIITQFSSIKTARRVVAIVLHFLKYLIYNNLSSNTKTKLAQHIPEVAQINSPTTASELQASDIATSEQLLIKVMQRELSQGDEQKWEQLALYKDENGLIRCHGQLQGCHLPRDMKEPILLLPNHCLTQLLVRHYHERCGHQGVNGTLANLRQLYWIPRGRQVVRKCITQCLPCKRWNGKPYYYPLSPPLPSSRTKPSKPFSHIGTDLAGPFYITEYDKIKSKRWIFLATCMTTRAVHLELVNNLSASQIINVLRRSISRRGKPQLIISDNASNFKLASEIVSTVDDEILFRQKILQIFLANEKITWKFITPLSPWKGGFHERMIGVMKATLKRVLTRKSLDESTFHTIVTECEAMVNSRPLVYTGSTVVDSLIIRPIDFLIPYANLFPFSHLNMESNSDDPEYQPQPSTKDQAIQCFRKQLDYLQNLWNVWHETYLLELRNFHQRRIKQKTFTRKLPRAGEVVLIMDDNTPRSDWPLGLILKLIPDQDGTVRTVTLRTSKSEIERSINMLIPLELDDDTPTQPPDDNIINKNDETNTNRESSPTPTSQPDMSDNIKCPIRRPMLPRKAKMNKRYDNYMTATTTNAANSAIAPSSTSWPWKHWLTVTLIATLLHPTYAQLSQQTQLQCVTGGISIHMLQQVERMQVCGNDYCIEVHEPDQNMKIQFPPEITLHTYHITLKSMGGNITQATHWACPPSPFCEQITCTFCSQLISNPECWPRIAIAITAVAFYILTVTAYIAFTVFRKVSRICTCVSGKNKFLRCFKLCSRKRSSRWSQDYTPLIELDKINTRWNTTTILRLITIVACAVPYVYTCQQTVLLPTTISQCSPYDHNCHNQTTVLAHINPMQPEMCIQLQHGNRQVHIVRIALQSLNLRCRKETLYFSRNTVTKVRYQKRCPHMGTCTGLKCAKITYNTIVDERRC